MATPCRLSAAQLRLLATGQFRILGAKLFKGLDGPTFDAPPLYDLNRAYEQWRLGHTVTDDDRRRFRAENERRSDKPTISVLMPLGDEAEAAVRSAIDSVRRQCYPFWELCIADNRLATHDVRCVVEEYSRLDNRIRLVRRMEPGEALTSALEMARGEFVAILRPTDQLAEQALQRVVQALDADPAVDLLYSDEDRIDAAGRHVEPFFKPGWSPEYLLGYNYACRLAVYRTALVRAAEGFPRQLAPLRRSTICCCA